MKKQHAIALLLIAIMAVSVLGVVGVTTAPRADAKYLTKIQLSSRIVEDSYHHAYRISGRLFYAYYVNTPKPRPVTGAVPNRWVYLYYKDCDGVCTGTRYWTRVRTNSGGYFVSPTRVATEWPVPGIDSVTLTSTAYTYARFYGDTIYGPSTSVVKTNGWDLL